MSPYATVSDVDLVERTLAGHADCFNILVERHVSAVRRCLNAMVRNRCDQEDLTQETLLKSWRYLPTFRYDASFRTWITRIAINEALQLYRRRRSDRSVPTGITMDVHADLSESPHDALVRAEAVVNLQGALREIPAKYRQILVLRDLDELSTEESARRLDSGVALVKSRLHRARKMVATAILRRSKPGRQLTHSR